MLMKRNSKVEKVETRHTVTLETRSWNPIHFAAFYKQTAVLEFFAIHYSETLDLRYAMVLSEADLLGAIEGVLHSGSKTGLTTFQEMQAKRFWIQVQRNLLRQRY